MKTFCIAGPVNKNDHYFIPKRLERTDELYQLIEEKKYFILHAPRQTGKTTALFEEVKKINSQGTYKALYVNVEPAQIARSNFEKGMEIILEEMVGWATELLDAHDPLFKIIADEGKKITGSSFGKVLQAWSIASEKPIILFIDEIDSLVGDTLISVLRQLRANYAKRPNNFPQTICLVGVRDVRDYRIWSESEQQMILGGSAFNIKAESLILPDFTLEEVKDLYNQHTQETDQQFTDEAIEYAFYLTQGQPWLINALAYQACFRDVTDRSMRITKEIIERAKEVLIVRQDTHLDVLISRLNEERVRTILDAIINSSISLTLTNDDDLKYMQDLGLIKRDRKEIRIANPIYKEVLPRALTSKFDTTLSGRSLDYQNSDGSLNTIKLLEKFVHFYRENSMTSLADFNYKESGPHLLLMAFLQRVINGGGTIAREYALNRKRVDLLVCWKTQRIVIELKIKHSEKTLDEGLQQTAGYMDIANATEGHLVIFDRDDTKTWDEKVYTRQEYVENKTITVWGL